MQTSKRRLWSFLLLALVLVLTCMPVLASEPGPDESKLVDCPDCAAAGVVLSEDLEAVPCETCGGLGQIPSPSRFYKTLWSLIPPHIAIEMPHNTSQV